VRSAADAGARRGGSTARDAGFACDGCLEKDDFIKKIVETQGAEL
jgi:hypothetical protein